MAWQATPLLRLRGNANLSRNRISRWTQFFGDESRVYRDVNPLLTPTQLLNASAEYTPLRPLTLGVTGREFNK